MSLYQIKNPSTSDFYKQALKKPGLAHDYLDKIFGSSSIKDYELVLKPIITKYKEPNVIDIGGGLGRHARHVIHQAKRLLIIEENTIAIESFKMCFLHQYRNKIEPILADSTKPLPIASNYADVIYSFATLSYLTKEGICYYLKESNRILKIGGRIVFTYISFNGTGLNQFINRYNKLNDKCNVVNPINIMSVETLFLLTKYAQFQVEKNECYKLNKTGDNTVIIARKN